MGILEDRFKGNMDVSCFFVEPPYCTFPIVNNTVPVAQGEVMQQKKKLFSTLNKLVQAFKGS